jgi:hypothetical protein
MSALSSTEVTRTFRALSPEQASAVVALLRAKDAAYAARGFGSRIFGLLEQNVAPRDITLSWLRERGATVRDLVLGARIPMSDLYAANVVRTFADLLVLGFQTADLTANRECFTCNHLVSLFQTTYDQLRASAECGGLTMSTLAFTMPPFTAGELTTLQVTARALLSDDQGRIAANMNYAILRTVQFTPQDWQDLGLDAALIATLGLTARATTREFHWDALHVQRLFGLPDAWLQS